MEIKHEHFPHMKRTVHISCLKANKYHTISIKKKGSEIKLEEHSGVALKKRWLKVLEVPG